MKNRRMKKYYENPEALKKIVKGGRNILKTIQTQDKNYQTEKEKTNHLIYLQQMEHI